MTYVVVMRDHEGVWHAIEAMYWWNDADVAMRAAIGVLSAIDYYPDFPVGVIKIIEARGGAGQDYYAQAPALERPLSL